MCSEWKKYWKYIRIVYLGVIGSLIIFQALWAFYAALEQVSHWRPAKLFRIWQDFPFKHTTSILACFRFPDMNRLNLSPPCLLEHFSFSLWNVYSYHTYVFFLLMRKTISNILWLLIMIHVVFNATQPWQSSDIWEYKRFNRLFSDSYITFHYITIHTWHNKT